MTNAVQFRPHPGSDSVITSAPMLRAYQTVVAYQVEHGEIVQTCVGCVAGLSNRHVAGIKSADLIDAGDLASIGVEEPGDADDVTG
jgi:hypothetical protein